MPMSRATLVAIFAASLAVASCSRATAQGSGNLENTAKELVMEYFEANPRCLRSSLDVSTGTNQDMQARYNAVHALISPYITWQEAPPETGNRPNVGQLIAFTGLTDAAVDAPIPDALGEYAPLFANDDSVALHPYGGYSIFDEGGPGLWHSGSIIALGGICLLRTRDEIEVLGFRSSGDEAYLDFKNTFQSPRALAPVIGTDAGMQSWRTWISGFINLDQPFTAYLRRYDQGWQVENISPKN